MFISYNEIHSLSMIFRTKMTKILLNYYNPITFFKLCFLTEIAIQKISKYNETCIFIILAHLAFVYSVHFVKKFLILYF